MHVFELLFVVLFSWWLLGVFEVTLGSSEGNPRFSLESMLEDSLIFCLTCFWSIQDTSGSHRGPFFDVLEYSGTPVLSGWRGVRVIQESSQMWRQATFGNGFLSTSPSQLEILSWISISQTDSLNLQLLSGWELAPLFKKGFSTKWRSLLSNCPSMRHGEATNYFRLGSSF